MKFILGVIVGTVLGPPTYSIVERRYGHVVIPYLLDVLKKVQENRERLEENRKSRR